MSPQVLLSMTWLLVFLNSRSAKQEKSKTIQKDSLELLAILSENFAFLFAKVESYLLPISMAK